MLIKFVLCSKFLCPTFLNRKCFDMRLVTHESRKPSSGHGHTPHPLQTYMSPKKRTGVPRPFKNAYPHRKPLRSLGTGLRQGPKGVRSMLSGAPLYEPQPASRAIRARLTSELYTTERESSLLTTYWSGSTDVFGVRPRAMGV